MVPFWVVSLFVPILGLGITWSMWLAPMKAVLNVRRTKDVGSLNPYPFVVTIINCIGWTMYGCMLRNYFVFFGNFTGLVLGFFYALSLFPYLVPDERESVEALLYIGIVFWCCVGFIAGAIFGVSDSQRTQALLFVGYVACCGGLSYYAGGLTKFVEVIRQRDSSSIHVPTAIVNTMNATLWTVYGLFAVGDVNIWLPNGVGIIFSLLQLFFAFIFPRRSAPGTPASYRPTSMKSNPADVDVSIGETTADDGSNPLHLTSVNSV